MYCRYFSRKYVLVLNYLYILWNSLNSICIYTYWKIESFKYSNVSTHHEVAQHFWKRFFFPLLSCIALVCILSSVCTRLIRLGASDSVVWRSNKRVRIESVLLVTYLLYTHNIIIVVAKNRVVTRTPYKSWTREKKIIYNNINTESLNQQQRGNKYERFGADFKRLLQTSVVGNMFVCLLRGPHDGGGCGDDGSGPRDRVGNTDGGATIRAVFIFVAARSSTTSHSDTR